MVLYTSLTPYYCLNLEQILNVKAIRETGWLFTL